MRQSGFTLIELMVTVSLAVILMLIAAPPLRDAILDNKMSSHASTFVASSRLARSEAIKRNAVVTLCRSSDGLTCAGSGAWQQGWIIVTGPTASPIVVERQQSLGDDFQFTANSYKIDFQPSGVQTGASALKLVRSANAAGKSYGCITVSATGLARYSKRSAAAACP